MIDVSDGLHIDLGRITTDYGLGAEITLEDLPLSEEYRLNYQIVTNDIYNLAVSGGEDYELLFTSDPSNEDKIYELSQKKGIAITKIGKVNETGLIKFIDENNFIRNFQRAGFVDFS